ncbi:hypothetical protein [Halovenus halobia]|uniref:hypothetical protein n=1 Tax=Halovenus halobia TaxID=3396622 RepID=UPI003F54E63E
MVNWRREGFWALLGNIVVGFGAGTATLAAFAPSFPVLGEPHFVLRTIIVSIGFAFFFAGYHITQAGTYRDPDESLLPSGSPDSETQPSSGSERATAVVVVSGVFVSLGVLGLGAGMRLFAMTIASWDPALGFLSGVVCISGYIFGHIGLNGVLL